MSRHAETTSWAVRQNFADSDANSSRQTGTLCCETADEAKTLIPSIAAKISDTDLQELLDEIAKLRQFTE